MRSASAIARFLRGDFARHGLLVFASTMLVNAFNYGFHFTISRRLGVVDYGDLYALLSALGLMSVPIASLTMVVVRYSAEFHSLGDRERLAELYRWVIVRCAVAGAVVFAAACAVAPLVASVLHLRDARSVVWAGLALALSIVLPGIRGIVQGTQDFGRFAISTAIEAGGKAGFGVAFVLLGYGVAGAFAGYAIGVAASIWYTMFAIRRHIAGARALEALRVNMRRLAATAAGATLATLAMTMLTSADTLLVKHFFSRDDAGLYSSVSLVGKVLFFVVGFVPTIILPKAAARRAAGEPAWPLIAQATAVTFAICGAGLVTLSFVPGTIVTLMAGHAFAGAAPFVFSYGLAMTLLGVTSVVVAYKVGIHRFDFVPFLLVVAAGEIVAIASYHPSLAAVIAVLTAGHAVALVSTLWRINAVAVAPAAGSAA